MDIIQVIIFIVIIAVTIVQQLSKSSKKENTASPKDVLADMFPEIEGEEQSFSPKPAIHKTKPSHNQPRQRKTTSRPTVPPATVNNQSGEKPIKLSTREEARRAFIYSEIFKRKYQ